jgi:hypothetical protein
VVGQHGEHGARTVALGEGQRPHRGGRRILRDPECALRAEHGQLGGLHALPVDDVDPIPGGEPHGGDAARPHPVRLEPRLAGDETRQQQPGRR